MATKQLNPLHLKRQLLEVSLKFLQKIIKPLNKKKKKKKVRDLTEEMTFYNCNMCIDKFIAVHYLLYI